MRLEKILVATDFSETSEAAVRYAVETSAKLGASVSVLHVYALPTYPVMPGGEVFVIGPQAAAEYLQAVSAEMKKLEGRLAPTGVKIDCHSIEGPIADTIVRVARDEGYDLIVMGTHGRTGIGRALIGSVAERVVRTASTPVLTVRHPAGAQPLPFLVPLL